VLAVCSVLKRYAKGRTRLCPISYLHPPDSFTVRLASRL
jgi:hypothetical protein